MGTTTGTPTVAPSSRKRVQARPLGYTQQRLRDAAMHQLQAALRKLRRANEPLEQLGTLRLTTDGVRDRAADIADAYDAAERELLLAFIILQSMTDNPAVDLGAILGPGDSETE